MLSVSARGTTNAVFQMAGLINGDGGSNYSVTTLNGNGTSTTSNRGSSQTFFTGFGTMADNAASANIFGSSTIYFPNYAGSNFKQIIIDGVNENGAATATSQFMASLWRNTAAITTIYITANTATYFAANSSFTLYGIKNTA
jgi:hypothetical protein